MFDFITNLIDTMGAFGVGIVMFLENVFPPIPSELVMPLAGFNAAQGGVSLLAVFVWGTIGTVLGAWLWYEVGRRLGRPRLQRFIGKYGIWLTLSQDDVQNAIEWFDRHDKGATFFGRMIPGVRTMISVPAGLAEMSLPRFMLYTTAGSALWNLALIAAGYLLQSQYDRVVDYLNPVTNLILAAIAVTYLYRVARQLMQRRKA
ncbi:membrane protein DedA, SNARE-associated domain [Loktanella salsilacus]|uniref:Membrane protein DedA, SNARE-associated domain n=1 Tax=Loktanella salsilacus TaxID=195913 RepID=A0A1I4EQL0_9RHOB|nr:DedA family protein [Loktanella salsilacus]SFL08025.1 membrane protein DedA, SNARE-associated domain [Loktanella salsilacus]